MSEYQSRARISQALTCILGDLSSTQHRKPDIIVDAQSLNWDGTVIEVRGRSPMHIQVHKDCPRFQGSAHTGARRRVCRVDVDILIMGKVPSGGLES